MKNNDIEYLVDKAFNKKLYISLLLFIIFTAIQLFSNFNNKELTVLINVICTTSSVVCIASFVTYSITSNWIKHTIRKDISYKYRNYIEVEDLAKLKKNQIKA